MITQIHGRISDVKVCLKQSKVLFRVHKKLTVITLDGYSFSSELHFLVKTNVFT